MATTRAKKAEMLEGLSLEFSKAKSIVFAKNAGLTVLDMELLRSTLRKEGISFQIGKKTLFQIAAEQNGVQNFDITVLDGAVGVAVCEHDEVTAAKMLAQFAKKNDKLELMAAIVDGKFVGKSETIGLSSLPSKEELYGKLMGSMLSPLSGFVGIGNGVISGFVRALDQIREQKA